MTDEGQDRAIAAIWKGIERIAAAIERLSDQRVAQAKTGEMPQKAETPEQPPLPGMPEEDWTPPDMTPPPRIWSNTVRVYDEIWRHFGKDGRPFGLAELCRDEGFLGDVIEATKGRVAPASLSKMLSVTTRADATYTIRKGVYRCNEPTDELREAIERVAKKRKEVAA